MWHPNKCDASIVSAESVGAKGASTKLSGGYAKVTDRKQHWQGLEQDITRLVCPGSTYKLSAQVAVSGTPKACELQATLKSEYEGLNNTEYSSIGR